MLVLMPNSPPCVPGENAAMPPRSPPSRCRLFRRDALRCARTRLHHDLDGIVDPLARIFDRGRQVFQREGMGVHFGGIKALLRHEGFGAMRRALALAADAVEVD